MGKYYTLSRVAGIILCGISLFVLAGWAFEIEILKSFIPGGIPMRVNTALCFFLSGLTLYLINNPVLRQEKISYFLVLIFASIVFLFGLFTQAEYLFGIDTGVDLLVMGNKSLEKPGGVFPGRMSPIPSFNFVLTGIIFFLMCAKPRKARIYRGLAYFILLDTLFATTVYLYHTASYVENPDFTSIAFLSGLLFIFLSLGILFARPNKALATMFSGKGFTDNIFWQVIPFVIVIPLVMGVIWLEGKKTGWDVTNSGTFLFAFLFLIVLIGMVVGNILYILKMERKFRVHEQNAYIASIVNFSDDAIISKTLDGIIQSWNKGAEKVFGYTGSEVVGHHISILIPDELIGEEKQIIEKIKSGDVVDHYETRRKRKDGSIINVSLTISPLIDHLGNITGASKIARDITRQKNIESELQKRSYYVEERIAEIVDVLLRFTVMDFSKKISITNRGDELDAIAVGINSLYEELESHIQQIKESNEQIQTIFRNAPDAIIVVDDEGRIIQWNPKAEEIFEWKADEVAGRMLEEVIIPQDQQGAGEFKLHDYMVAVDNESLNRSIELQAMRKGGKLFDAELSISPSSVRGKNYFIGILNDITLRKQSEETRRRYIEQLAQNKELESFAYIVSHDLKTPLQGIAKIADWLVKDYGDKLDDTGKQYLELLKSRMIRLEALINGILAYSRAGRVEEDKMDIDFNELIAEIREFFALPETAKIIVPGPLPTLVNSKSAMMQVFGNLISNAIKHNDKVLPEIEVGATENGSSWVFYVKDNGPGIEKEYHEKVFKVFQTLKKDAKNNTGIGLGIVKKIIEKEGGKIWIESETGKGCTFFFTIRKQPMD